MRTATNEAPGPSLVDSLLRVGPRWVERTRRQVEFAAVVVHGVRRMSGPPREHGVGGSGRSHEDGRVASVLDHLPPVDEPTPTPVADDGPGAVADAPSEADLPIDGYDSLAASQVVPRLATLTASELRAVQGYERAGRHRQTILNRVEQLLGDT